jgi:hypothetical protein
MLWTDGPSSPSKTFCTATAAAYRGLALAKQGQPEAGIRQIGQALSSLEAMGPEFYRSVNLSLLAEAHTCARQVDEGSGALAGALTAIRQDRRARPGGRALATLRGTTSDASRSGRAPGRGLLPPGERDCPPPGGPILELRAATSLSRLWQEQGKRSDARRLHTSTDHRRL